MKRLQGRKGLSLIELVMAIVILGLVVPVALTVQAYLAVPHAKTEITVRATQLAHALLEEIQSKRFDELLERVNNRWSTLGPDQGESSRLLYDDVDDYDGFTENLTGDLAGFTRSVQVRYLTGFEPGIVWGPPPIDIGFADPISEYKVITITVTGPAVVSVQLIGLATTANSQMAPQEGLR